MSKRYSIKVTTPSGAVSYLIHRDKTKWCLRTARKYLAEFTKRHGIPAEIEEAYA